MTWNANNMTTWSLSFLNIWILKCFPPIISMSAVDFTARNLEFLGFQSRNCGQVATPNPRAQKTSLKRSSREVNYSCARNSQLQEIGQIPNEYCLYIQVLYLYIVLTCESTIPDSQPSFIKCQASKNHRCAESMLHEAWRTQQQRKERTRTCEHEGKALRKKLHSRSCAWLRV